MLGLFNAGNMSLEWSGLQATPSPGSGLPGRADVPGESAAGQRAVARGDDGEGDRALLDDDGVDGRARSQAARRGFFLQVEGASIDKQDHVESPCQQIGETIAFDRAIRSGSSSPAHHPDTLIIVTADHAHTSQIVPVPAIDRLDAARHAEHAADEGRQFDDDDQLRARVPTDSRRITRAPKFGSPRRVRRPRTSSA